MREEIAVSIETIKCSTCPAQLLPSSVWIRLARLSDATYEAVLRCNALRGWQAFDNRWFCLLCVKSGGMYARRGE